MILLGNSLIAKWVREKVIVSVEHCVAFVGHAAFLLITRYTYICSTATCTVQELEFFQYFLTRPSAHNKNFPYHVRTTQIGVLEAISSHTTVGNHTLESFGHHGYGVSPANGR